jgi:very-short-patch-repair endonuclease
LPGYIPRFCSNRCYRLHESETPPHRRLREALQALGVTLECEHPLGRHLFDLYVPAANLLIEVDGVYWHSRPEMAARDVRKARAARAAGFLLVRVPEHEVSVERAQRLVEEYAIPHGAPPGSE